MRALKILRNIILFILIWAVTTAAVFTAAAFISIKVNKRMNERVKITKYTYSDADIPSGFDGYKLLVISDLHNAPFGDQIDELVYESDPDVILMLGDMPQLPDYSVTESSAIGKAVGKDYPIYAVSGNHETQGEGYDKIIDAWKGHNITPLENDTVWLDRGGDSSLLSGLKDPKQDNVSDSRLNEMRRFIKDSLPEKKAFSILLCHRAGLYPEFKDCGANLILSGDLHGGIIKLPFVGGLIGKEHELFPEYSYGYIKEGGSSAMIVSGGCDKNPKKVRFFNQPELVLITLKSL